MGDAKAADALERTVLELEAMAAIFDDSVISDDSEARGEEFVVTTPDALKGAQSAIDCGDVFEVPRIEVEVLVHSASDDAAGSAWLRIGLPPGYPSMQSAEVTLLSTQKNLPRSLFDELSCKLQLRAKELFGAEAIMEIITECRYAMESWIAEEAAPNNPNNKNDTEDDDCCAENAATINEQIARRWIWVHHITNTSRLKQIVAEAEDLNLGGFLKGGYPGVVVVEGNATACDEFVTFIKGNKSRPGGFGRNWGHHVRGEAKAETRQLPESFEELDDMGRLGELCAQFGVEDEFREFILQHK